MAITLWLLCACIAWLIGSRKGAHLLGLFLGLLLGPLGILAAIAMKGNRKQCPSCKEWVHKEARTCPHCAGDVSSVRVTGLRREVSSGTVVIVLAVTALLLASIWYSAFDTTSPSPVGSPTQSRPAAAVENPGDEAGPSSRKPAGIDEPSQLAKSPTGPEEPAPDAPVPVVKTPEQRAADLEADTVDNYRTGLDFQCAEAEHQVELAAKAVAAGDAPQGLLDVWTSQYRSCLLREANSVELFQEQLEQDAQQCHDYHPDWDAYRCMSNDYQNPLSEKPPDSDNADQPAVPPNASSGASTPRTVETTANSDNQSASTPESAVPSQPSASSPLVSCQEAGTVTHKR